MTLGGLPPLAGDDAFHVTAGESALGQATSTTTSRPDGNSRSSPSSPRLSPFILVLVG